MVSVIIPCYNGAAFLGDAIESVQLQSYPNIEIIVVDDGSTDNSFEIAQSFPVRYIRMDHCGLCEARNRGILESKGAYIVFLDADDRLQKGGIEAGVRLLEQRTDCAMAVGDHIFVTEQGTWLANSRKECLQRFHYEALLRSNFVEMIASVLFRRTIFDQIGGFDPTLRVAEDYELYLRIAREYPVCCHSFVVAEYRIHGANASRNSELMLAMTLRVLERQITYVQDDAGRLIALRTGVRSWSRQYGRQLTLQLSRSVLPLRSDSFRRQLLLLMRHYPQGVAMLMLIRILPPQVLKLRLSASFGLLRRLKSPASGTLGSRGVKQS